MKEKDREKLRLTNHDIRQMFMKEEEKSTVTQVSDKSAPTKMSLFKLWESRCSDKVETAVSKSKTGRGDPRSVRGGDGTEYYVKDPDAAEVMVKKLPVEPNDDDVCTDVRSNHVRKYALSVSRWPDDTERMSTDCVDANVDARSMPGRATTVSDQDDLCLGEGGDGGEGGDNVDGGSRIIIKKSRNLDRVGRAEHSDANLQSKIQLFENISRRKIQAEDSAEYDPIQKASEGGLDLTE